MRKNAVSAHVAMMKTAPVCFRMATAAMIGLWVLSACSSERENTSAASRNEPPAVRSSEAQPSDKMVSSLWDVEGGSDWAGYGRTHFEDHFSPLDQINEQNIGELGLAWYKDLPPTMQSHTAPLAVDGVLYYAIGYSIVYAADAATGEDIWRYDSKTTEVAGEKLRQAWGVRGLAYGHDRIFVGTLDGRLIALDAMTGEEVWSIDTTEGPGDGRYITGAPRVFGDKVIIGHGGAEYANVRGYVTAYQVDSGRQLWRFYTVPGNPREGFENAALEMAAKTWTGDWWKFGGGGTVWNAITYDPELNRVYIGVGNGAPWNQRIRSPGGGDNLFLCSIVALDAGTGEYIWHYQANPGETWDYNSAMDMALARLTIDGAERRVLLHAPKNGFFYVIDRDSGRLLSAEAFVHQNWALHIDLETGRPVESPLARANNGTFVQYPGAYGGHNWMAMAFSPRTKLAYIPTTDYATVYDQTGVDVKKWRRGAHIEHNTGFKPFAAVGVEPPPQGDFGSLLAWDPVLQKPVWSAPLKHPFNGGVAATAGNLVFQGNAEGIFAAYAADTGKMLWSFNAQNGILAQPITYQVDGSQYITIFTGFGGGAALTGTMAEAAGWDYRNQQRRILTFKLGGAETLPSFVRSGDPEFAVDPEFRAVDSRVEKGGLLYAGYCLGCHGFAAVAGGAAPDLRRSGAILSIQAFEDIVREGALEARGMPRFSEFTDDQLGDVRHYLQFQTRASHE